MHSVLFIFVPIFLVVMVCFTFGMILSPKLRSKFMGHQLKIQKQVLDDNAEVIESISTKSANLGRNAVKTTASAIKEGFESTGDVYCKHCGASIDDDSAFCKKCGKKQ